MAEVLEPVNQGLLYGVVLLSAAGHASWNAVLKKTPDRLVMMVAIRIVGLGYGLVLLWCAGMPSGESLKWLISSAAIMWLYQALLVEGYQIGDLSFVYPFARGLAPILVTGFAFFLIGETITAPQLLGVTCISLGIVTMSLLGHGVFLALIYAILIGSSVAAYSLLSASGVRVSGNLFGFSAALEIASGVGFLAYAANARGRSLVSSVLAIWPAGIGAGLLSVVGYLTFLVAAVHLPVGPVTAIRECSALFGVLIGVFILKESSGLARIVGAALIMLGILILSTL